MAAFDEHAELVGLMLATHGALAVALSANQQQVENLRRALVSNREIGVAMGVLMTRHQVTRDQAFGLLRMASQNTNRKLHEVAGRSPTPASCRRSGEADRGSRTPRTDGDAQSRSHGASSPIFA